MEQLKEGEYVRTNNGSIFKIIGGNVDDYLIDVEYFDLQKIENDIYDDLMWLNYNDNGGFISRIVKKHSFNLIDLIEVGDYVNGSFIIRAAKDCVDDEGTPIILAEDYDEWSDNGVIYNEDIKTIVTKERFKAMEYRIGG